MEVKPNSSPKRSYMDDPGIEWRHGYKPDYRLVNEKFMKERTKVHPEGSLEKIVEDLVKTWEMESSHKALAKDWKTVDKEVFFISSNNGKKFNLDDNINIGNYNILLHDSVLYDTSKLSNEESHGLFRNVFKGGFAWEVLEVFSGPPNVAFTWRHWGTFDGDYSLHGVTGGGDYNDVKATGEKIEMFGSCFVKVNEQLKVQSIEVYYDPNKMMKTLTGMRDKTTCPFHH